MGAVYEARDTQLDRIVALKIPRAELVNDPVILQRFLNEARAAGAIRHPNICPIYDVGQLDGQHFITMPLVEGMSLSAWMEHRTVSLREAVELTRKLASALQAIHAVGIRHRDIKASNVMIDERGEPLLMDFGLARLAQTDTQLTQSGSLVGTPAYMAPEQIQLGASGGDERSDIYSLGVLLYQMLTGRLPFEGPMTRVLVDIATKTPPPVESLRPDVDPNLANICRKAMAREPAQRFQTAKEFEDALTNCLRSLETLTRPDSQPMLMPTTKTDDAEAVGWDKLASSAGPPEAPRKLIGGPARRSAAGPTLRRRTLIAAAIFFVLAAAIVIKISDRAELVITSPEPGLEVRIVQLAQPEQERTLTFGKNSVRVRSGEVEVVLTGANADEYEVIGDKITLKRFGREVVEIKRRETAGSGVRISDLADKRVEDKKSVTAKSEIRTPDPSPWDDLDPAQIPEAERVPRQPEGLVAVLGQHRRRVSNIIRSSSVSSDGTQFTLTTNDGLYLYGRDPKQPDRFFPSTGGVGSATLLPDGRIAAFTHDGGTKPLELQIFAKPHDGMPLEKQFAITEPDAASTHLATASSDGRWLAALEGTSVLSVGLWKLSDDAPPQRAAKFVIPNPHGNATPVSFSTDSHWFCFTDKKSTDNNHTQSSIHLIDLRRDTPREAIVLKADADEKSDAPAKGFDHAAFLSDGRLATADRNGRIWFWKINDGEPQRVGSLRDTGIISSATQSKRMVINDTGAFRVWDLAADPPKLLGSASASFPADNIATLAIAPNGETVFTGHHNGAIRLWNVSSNGVTELDPLLPNPTRRDGRGRVAVVDRLLCTSTESQRVGIWRPTTNGLQAVPIVSLASEVLGASLPQRQLVVSELGAGGIALLRCDADRLTPTRRVTANYPGSAALNDEGRRLAIGRHNGTDEVLELWGWESDDLPAKKLSEIKSSPHPVQQLAFAEAGRTLVGRLGGFVIQIWDVKDDQIIPRTKLPQRQCNHFAVAPDGQTPATGNHGSLELWNLKSDLTQPTASFAMTRCEAVAFSPDGRRLAASFWENGASTGVQIIHLASGVVEKRLTFPGRVHELTFTDDSRHLITGNANATIYVVRLAKPQ